MHLNKRSGPVAVNQQGLWNISTAVVVILEVSYILTNLECLLPSEGKLSHFIFSTKGKGLLNLFRLHTSKHMKTIIPTVAFEGIRMSIPCKDRKIYKVYSLLD